MSIHYALPDEAGRFAPLCGETGAPNWTVLRDAVTCPECLRRMTEQRAPRELALEDDRFGPK